MDKLRIAQTIEALRVADPVAARTLLAHLMPLIRLGRAIRHRVVSDGRNQYDIYETPVKRKIDKRRFEWWKQLPPRRGKPQWEAKPYVVTFQTPTGTRASCSCKAGIYGGPCKHKALSKELAA